MSWSKNEYYGVIIHIRYNVSRTQVILAEQIMLHKGHRVLQNPTNAQSKFNGVPTNSYLRDYLYDMLFFGGEMVYDL